MARIKLIILSDYQKRFVTEQRHFGFSYKSISEKVGYSRQVVKRFCKSIGLGIDIHPNVIKANKQTGLKRRRERTVYICKNCGIDYTRKKNRFGDEGKIYCSRECFYEYTNKHKRIAIGGYFEGATCVIYFPYCKTCDVQFAARQSTHKICKNIKCQFEKREHELELGRMKAMEGAVEKHADKVFKCKLCREPFSPIYGDKHKLCSNVCIVKSKAIVRKEFKRRRRALLRTTIVEKFKDIEIFIRDGWKCQICKKKINKKAIVPNGNAPTIDHITPLSKNGTHERKNVQLACFRCNCIKGNGTIDGGEQLRMFG